MFRVKRIDHVAIATDNLDGALAPFRDLLGLTAGLVESSSELKTKAVLIPVGDSNIELITPLSGNLGLEKFLAKRGPGLHHIAIEVAGLDQALAFLKALNVPLINETAVIGARGHRVAFLHPKAMAGVLIELVESP